MDRMISRRTVAAVLALLFAQPLGAAGLQSPGFDKCRVQKQCRLLSHAELDRLRGGFSLMSAVGPIDITFGISQAVYVNGQLVALTQLVLPGTGQAIGTLTPSSAQMEALNAALKGASVIPVPSSAATGTSAPSAVGSNALQSIRSAAAVAPPAVNVPQSPATSEARPSATLKPPINAGPPVQAAAASLLGAGSSPGAAAAPTASTTAGLNATLSVPTSTGSSSPVAAIPAPSAVSSRNNASAGPTTVLVNGAPVIPGSPVINVPTAANIRTLTIQNGPGNVVVPSAADIRAATNATIIQNTLNGQTIQSMTQLNISLGLSKTMNAASVQDRVRQGMAAFGR